MRVAGAFLSGVGHAGVIGLAAIGPPFLWAPRDAPVPAMVVTLLGPAEFAALAVPPAPAPPVIVRGSEPAAVQEARLRIAQAELDAAGEFDRVVVNDDVARAADELVGLLTAPSPGLVPGE